METSFDNLIDSYLANNIGISENFLSKELAKHLKENLLTLHANKQFFAAGTGVNKPSENLNLYRSDQIHWLDPLHNDVHENSFFLLMDRFVSHLNATCYAGIKSYEFHYSLYEKGSFYSKHLDQFRNNDSRQFSMVMYLNDNWKENDGGELRIHEPNCISNISPTNGKSVFFKSNELLHEVLVTNEPRMSITGWLKS